MYANLQGSRATLTPGVSSRDKNASCKPVHNTSIPCVFQLAMPGRRRNRAKPRHFTESIPFVTTPFDAAWQQKV
jgi:hypothetical protein